MYLVLLQNSTLVPEDKIENALELVQETCWEGYIEDARQQRLKLFELAGLDTGLLLKPSSAASKKDNRRQQTISDENESYSSLVESSGF